MTDPTDHLDDATEVSLALGELAGRERAEALAHVSDCVACRRRVQELAEAAEQVLLAAPRAEPPAGFETAVLERLGPEPGRNRSRRWPRLLAVAAAALVALAAVVAVGRTGDGDSELAEAAMVTPTGRAVGRAWRYDADPTWILVSVPRWHAWQGGDPPRHYRLTARLDDGRTVPLGTFAFSDPDGTWGTSTPIPAPSIRSVTVTDASGRVWCRGEF